MSRWFFLIFLLIQISALSQEVEIDISIEPQKQIEQSAVGIITITHPSAVKIDPTSFLFQDQPLSVELIRHTLIGDKESGTTVSIYRFAIPLQPPGEYTLTPISMKIANNLYNSSSVKYSVEPQTFSSSPPAGKSGENIFTLEAKVDGPSPLYPGQRAKLIYLITFNQNIDLTASDLPLIYPPKEFHKVGQSQIREVQDYGITIQEISQEVEAIKPGEFHIQLSTIEGYAYEYGANGQKAYKAGKLKAESPSIDLIVSPFPKLQQPLSFNGAIGALSIDLQLVSSNEVLFGEKLVLQLEVKGAQNLEELALPNISCQPGFSGFFQFDDLVSAGVVSEATKTFSVELRPISTLMVAIPSIEMASFNPDTADYTVYQTKPIPIQVAKPADFSDNAALTPAPMEISRSDEQGLRESFNSVPAPELEIKKGTQIADNRNTLSWSHTAVVFYIIPVGALFLLLEIQLKQKWLIWQENRQKLNSHKVLKKALRERDPYRSLNLIKEAMRFRLKEGGLSREREKLIHHFIGEIESLQYDKPQPIALKHIQRKAEQLLDLFRNSICSLKR